MKRNINRLLIVVGCIVIAIIFSYFITEHQKQNNIEMIHDISAEEFVLGIKEKKNMVIFCGRETIGENESYLLMLKKTLEDEAISFFCLDIESIQEEESLKQYQIEQGTLIIIEDGQINFYREPLNEEEVKKVINTTHIDSVDLRGITCIGYDELKEIESTSTDFLVYIGRDDCKDCKDFKPILEGLLNDISRGVYYLDLNEVREKNGNKKREEIIERYEIDWVPTLIHINNGIQVSRYKYFDEESALTKFSNWLRREFYLY